MAHALEHPKQVVAAVKQSNTQAQSQAQPEQGTLRWGFMQSQAAQGSKQVKEQQG